MWQNHGTPCNHQAVVAQLEVEHNVNCVVVGFIADMELAEKKGIKGLDKVRLATAEEMAGVSWGPSLLCDFNIF